MATKGKLIVIEGLDGSGKATQAKAMQAALAQTVPLQKVSFPDYSSPSSALVKMYLAGEFGSAPGDVNAFAASAFYAVDRYASYKKNWQQFYLQGGIVLADRYATSNQIHQLAKLPENEWQAYIAWQEDFEFTKLAIPRPDLVLYLDVEPAISQQMLMHRYGDAAKRDIHERDVAYLLRCRAAAMWCVQHLGWQKITCTAQGAMRPIEDITQELLALIRRVV